MKFIDFEYGYDWTDNTQWRLPEDEQLFQAEFPHVDEFVQRATSMLASLEICIQAGACIGLVPIRYAQEFEEVITFEPLPITYNCLIKNILSIPCLPSILWYKFKYSIFTLFKPDKYTITF